MSKSFVTLEQRTCFVCGKTYDTGSLLIDRRMKDRFDMHTNVGLGMCKEHEDKIKEGYVILIGCDASKSEVKDGGHTLDPKKAYRTGSLAFIKPELYRRLFNMAVPPNSVAFSDQGVLEWLETLQPAPEEKETPPDA